MNQRDRYILQKNYKSLLEVRYASISPHLISNFVIDPEMHSEIDSLPTDWKKMEKLLALLPTRGENSFKEFVSALKPNYNWLANNLEFEVQGSQNDLNINGPASASASASYLKNDLNLKDVPISNHSRKIVKEFESSHVLCKNWTLLAYAMNLKASIITNIRREMANEGGCSYAFREILQQWITQEGESKATFRALIDILKEENVNDVAEKLFNIWNILQFPPALNSDLAKIPNQDVSPNFNIKCSPQFTKSKDESGSLQNQNEDRVLENELNPWKVLGLDNEEWTYKMSSKPKGFALIINNINFEGNPEPRMGSEVDEKKLKTLFEKLGFEVTVAIDVKKESLLYNYNNGVLKTFTEQFQVREVDCCLVCILSHGESDNYILTTDFNNPRKPENSRVHLIQDIVQQFNDRYFPIFQGKPKIFIVQACRGEINNRPLRNSSSSLSSIENDSSFNDSIAYDSALPSVAKESYRAEFNDIIILNSTVASHLSSRDVFLGSWFISILSETFSSYSDKCNIFQLHQIVAKEMCERHQQSPSIELIGRNKAFYFNPKC